MLWCAVVLAGCGDPEFTGRVVDQHGLPVAGVAVNLTSVDLSAVTDSAGEYRLVCEPGAWSVAFSRAGYAGRNVRLDFPEGDKALADVRLWETPPAPGVLSAATRPYQWLAPASGVADYGGVRHLGANVVPAHVPRLALYGKQYADAAFSIRALERTASSEPGDMTAGVRPPMVWGYQAAVEPVVVRMDADRPFVLLGLEHAPRGMYALILGNRVYDFVLAGPDMAEAYRVDPWRALEADDFEAVARAADLRLEYQPDSADLHLVAGIGNQGSGRPGRALEHLLRAVELGLGREDLARAHKQLADVYWKMGDMAGFTRHTLEYDNLERPGVDRGFVALLSEVRTSDGAVPSGVMYSVGDSVSAAWNSSLKEKELYFAVDSGPVAIRFEKYGYKPVEFTVEVAAGRLTEVTETIVLERRDRPHDMVTAAGRIVEAGTGHGVPAVEVSFFRRPAGPDLSTEADATGAYTHTSLPVGDYVVGFISPVHTRVEMFASLSSERNRLPTAVLYRLRKVEVRYVVNAADNSTALGPDCTTCETRDAVLALTHHRAPTNGLDILSGEIKGDWVGREQGLHLYLTQANDVVSLHTAPGVLAVKTARPFDEVVDASMYTGMRKLAGAAIHEKDVFILSVESGRRVAKMEVVSITMR